MFIGLNLLSFSRMMCVCAEQVSASAASCPPIKWLCWLLAHCTAAHYILDAPNPQHCDVLLKDPYCGQQCVNEERH